MPDNIRVLYVDDEPGLLEIGRLFLEDSATFLVEVSLSPEDALKSHSFDQFDAIVSDYQMPGMDGIAFLKAVREKYGDIPFILFTGRGREEVVIQAINNGADFYLQKGGDPRAQFAELAHKIRQAVVRKRAQEELKAAYEQITASEEELRDQYDEIAAAHRNLEESRQQMAEIADTVPGVVFQSRFHPGGDEEFTFLSRRAFEVFGISSGMEEFRESFLARVDPRDRDRMDRSIQEAASGATPWEFEGRFVKPSGETIWFQALARPVRKNPFLYYNGVLLDITSRKTAEEAATEQAARLREAQELAHLGFWSWDVRTGAVEWSDEVYRVFGLDKAGFVPTIDSILARSPWPEEQARGQELLRKVAESHEPGSYEQRFLRPDNSIGYYYSTFQGKYDEAGSLTAIVGTMLDITSRKKAELELRASEECLRLFIRDAPAALAMFDTGMRYLAASRRWMEDYHLGDRDIAGLSHYEVFPQISAEIKAVHSRGLAGEVVSSSEDRFVRGDGSVQWLAWEVRPWYTAGNTVGGIIIYSEDITARKQTGEALRESVEMYRNLVEKANEAITIIQDGKHVYVNPRMTAFTGIPADELMHRPFFDCVWPEDREMLRERYTRRMNGEDIPATYDFRLLGPGGEPRWVSVSIAKIHWNGRPATLNLMTDITERKMAEAALQEAGRKLALVNSVTWHDIRNQLITLIGFARRAMKQEQDPEIAGFLSKIEASAATVRQQIEFMEACQELGAGSPAWFGLVETIGKIGAKDVTCSSPCNGIEIFADPMLGKVFSNLFDNARRHGETVTEITVRCEPEGDSLRVVVEDNGTGVPDNEKEKIFLEGYGKNTGLGLYLVREILAITGITIHETGTSGKGARFAILVPKECWRRAIA